MSDTKISELELIEADLTLYKNMKVSTEPPVDKEEFNKWSKRESSRLSIKESELKHAIAEKRARLKAELLRLNALEHDLLYTSSQHPMHNYIADHKKGKLYGCK